MASALAPYRNRDAAFVLATFLARFWSGPQRITDAFPIDRRELADRPDLGLTQDQVRGAIKTLEEIGFLDRALSSGSRYRATEEGLHRKAILFVFGPEYHPLFRAANKRAAAARGGRLGNRRLITPSPASRPSMSLAAASGISSPKSNRDPERSLLMGDVRRSGLPPQASEPNLKLESALDRLLNGIRQSRDG